MTVLDSPVAGRFGRWSSRSLPPSQRLGRWRCRLRPRRSPRPRSRPRTATRRESRRVLTGRCGSPRASATGSGASPPPAGADGALWFTERNTDKIGRITTAGTITETAVPTAGSAPEGIAAGSDGALWFTELGGRIGRITTAGTVTEFAIPTAGSQPLGITLGLMGRCGPPKATAPGATRSGGSQPPAR